MKRVFSLLVLLCLLLFGCAGNDFVGEKFTFHINESGDVVSGSGIVYTHLANEGILCYLVELEFVGSVQGEVKSVQHLGMSCKTGMYSIRNAENDNVLIRILPDNEWCSIYRKSSLPVLDYSVDNCIRLEFVPGSGENSADAVHINCGEGIVNQSEIAAFFTEVRKQECAFESGMYDLVRKSDGMLENCYTFGVIYGFLAEEPNLAISMPVTSYNDLAYSVSIEDSDYVLPETWLRKIQDN